MPNIKPELRRGFLGYIHTRQGETILVLTVGGVIWALGTAAAGTVAVFVSETLYPFSYAFFHTPLHEYLPTIATEPSFIANLLFGALFSLAVYTFEKNIFYRRFHLALKALFASVAACAFVFVSGLISYLFEISGLGALGFLFLEAEANELPSLVIYYYITSLPLFALCDSIRRRIILLP